MTRELSTETVWERVFTVAPLVIVGSKGPDGTYDLAPKHMAMPLGWGDRYCFVCTPRHNTHRNEHVVVSALPERAGLLALLLLEPE